MRRLRILAFLIPTWAILAVLASANLTTGDVERAVEKVRGDFLALRGAIEGMGVDTCCLLPDDTSHLGEQHPTFAPGVTHHPNGPKQLYGRGGLCLTTPIPYLNELPRDPFAAPEGGPYGYLMWSFNDHEPSLYVLHGRGPDGDVDLPLARLHAIANETFEYSPRETDRRILGERGAVVLHRLIDRFQYDPTNGTISDGDMIYLGTDLAIPTSRTTDTLPEGRIEDLLARHPPDSRLPERRWKGASRYLRIHPEEYARYGRHIASDPSDADSPLGRIHARLGKFAWFFSGPREWGAEERALLDAWRAQEPAWWAAIEMERIRLEPGESGVVVAVPELARFEHARRMCLLLLAAYETGNSPFPREEPILRKANDFGDFNPEGSEPGPGPEGEDYDPAEYHAVVRVYSGFTD